MSGTGGYHSRGYRREGEIPSQSQGSHLSGAKGQAWIKIERW